jgi:uncharacterized protein YggE
MQLRAYAGPAVLATAILFGGSVLGVRAQTASQPPPDTITVTGTATVTMPPDEAQVTGSVQTQAGTAAAAADENNRILQAVVEAVQALGIPSDQIVTSGSNVGPQYSYTQPQQGQPSQPPTIADYQATSGVTVTTMNLKQASDILQAMATAGATNLSGPTYKLQHPEVLDVQAEGQASADARQKAEAIAAGLGVRLGDVLTVTEGYGTPAAIPRPSPPPPVAPPPPSVAPIPLPTVTAPPVLPPSALSSTATITVVFAVVNGSGAAATSGP